MSPIDQDMIVICQAYIDECYGYRFHEVGLHSDVVRDLGLDGADGIDLILHVQKSFGWPFDEELDLELYFSGDLMSWRDIANMFKTRGAGNLSVETMASKLWLSKYNRSR